MDTRRLLNAVAVTLAFGLLSVGCSDAAGIVDPPSEADSLLPEPLDPNAGPPVIAFVSTREGSPHIYVAAADGSGVRRLTSGGNPAWSWDGNLIAFSRGASQQGPAGIYVMDAGGEDQTYVGPGFGPAWSPDGRIAFSTDPWASDREEGGIMVMNADGSAVQLLISHDYATATGLNPWGYGIEDVSQPSWSPDGSKVAFRLWAGYGGGGLLYVMNADGSSPRYLQEGLNLRWSIPGGPSWSPDGSRVSAVVASGSIALYDPESGAETFPQIQLPDPWRADGRPDWSPDGTHLAFEAFDSSDLGAPSFGSPNRIFVASLETGEVRRLIPEAESPALAEYDDDGVAWSRVAR